MYCPVCSRMRTISDSTRMGISVSSRIVGRPFLLYVRFRRASASPPRLLPRHRSAPFSLSITAGRLTNHRGKVARQVCAPAHDSLPCPRTDSGSARDHARHYGLIHAAACQVERIGAPRKAGASRSIASSHDLRPRSMDQGNSDAVLTICNTPDGGCVSCMHLG